MLGSYLFDPNVCMAPCHDQLDTTIEKKQKRTQLMKTIVS